MQPSVYHRSRIQSVLWLPQPQRILPLVSPASISAVSEKPYQSTPPQAYNSIPSQTPNSDPDIGARTLSVHLELAARSSSTSPSAPSTPSPCQQKTYLSNRQHQRVNHGPHNRVGQEYTQRPSSHQRRTTPNKQPRPNNPPNRNELHMARLETATNMSVFLLIYNPCEVPNIAVGLTALGVRHHAGCLLVIVVGWSTSRHFWIAKSLFNPQAEPQKPQKRGAGTPGAGRGGGYISSFFFICIHLAVGGCTGYEWEMGITMSAPSLRNFYG